MERTLEERHYTGFLVSSTYHAMLHQAAVQGVDFMTECAGLYLGIFVITLRIINMTDDL